MAVAVLLLSSLASKPGLHQRFGFHLALPHLQLAENGLQADEELVPLVFHTAQGIVTHFAEEANGWPGRDQGMDILAADRTAIDGTKNQFQLLRDDAFDFQELIFVLRRELFAACHGHESVELLPTLQIALHAEDKLFDIGLAHKWRRLGV